MATMNISLPDQMKTWVEENVSGGKYANASDYVRDLIRRDRTRNQAFEEMQNLITEGIESGVSAASVRDVWNSVKASSNNG